MQQSEQARGGGDSGRSYEDTSVRKRGNLEGGN